MLTLYFDNKVNWKNQFFSITCPCYKTKVWEVFQFFFSGGQNHVDSFVFEIFWRVAPNWFEKIWFEKKNDFKIPRKKSSYFHLFIYSFIYLFTFFCRGGGRWGELGGRRLKDLTMQHVESSYICWIQVLDTISQNLKKNINQ